MKCLLCGWRYVADGGGHLCKVCADLKVWKKVVEKKQADSLAAMSSTADKCQKKWEHNFAPPAAAIRTWRLGEGTHLSFERLGGVPGQVLDELQRMADEAGCETCLMDHEGKKCLAVRWPAAGRVEYVPTVFAPAADTQSCYYCGKRNCGGHKEKIK